MSYIRCNSSSGGGAAIDFSEVDALPTQQGMLYHYNPYAGAVKEIITRENNTGYYFRLNKGGAAGNVTDYYTFVIAPKNIQPSNARYTKIRGAGGEYMMLAGIKDGEIHPLGFYYNQYNGSSQFSYFSDGYSNYDYIMIMGTTSSANQEIYADFIFN